VYKNPPYPIFYDVVYHSYALVPMLASNLYYSAKFSSTVLTSFITGGCKTLALALLLCCTRLLQCQQVMPACAALLGCTLLLVYMPWYASLAYCLHYQQFTWEVVPVESAASHMLGGNICKLRNTLRKVWTLKSATILCGSPMCTLLHSVATRCCCCLRLCRCAHYR
jgi:hypothetical protein